MSSKWTERTVRTILNTRLPGLPGWRDEEKRVREFVQGGLNRVTVWWHGTETEDRYGKSEVVTPGGEKNESRKVVLEGRVCACMKERKDPRHRGRGRRREDLSRQGRKKTSKAFVKVAFLEFNYNMHICECEWVCMLVFPGLCSLHLSAWVKICVYMWMFSPSLSSPHRWCGHYFHITRITALPLPWKPSVPTDFPTCVFDCARSILNGTLHTHNWVVWLYLRQSANTFSHTFSHTHPLPNTHADLVPRVSYNTCEVLIWYSLGN